MSAAVAKNAANVKRDLIGKSGIQSTDGKVPTHVHKDPDGNTWLCDSPYCVVLEGLSHPDDGGPQPIVVGQEPWRR